METLVVWCAVAQQLTRQKDCFRAELKRAEAVLDELSQSIQIARTQLLVSAATNDISQAELAAQEQHLLLVGRLIVRKRSALLRTAALQCLDGVKLLTAKLQVSKQRPPRKILPLLRRLRGLVCTDCHQPDEELFASLAQEVEVCLSLLRAFRPVV